MEKEISMFKNGSSLYLSDVHWVGLDVPREEERGRNGTEGMFLQRDGKNQLYIWRELTCLHFKFSASFPFFSTIKPSYSEASLDHWWRH